MYVRINSPEPAKLLTKWIGVLLCKYNKNIDLQGRTPSHFYRNIWLSGDRKRTSVSPVNQKLDRMRNLGYRARSCKFSLHWTDYWSPSTSTTSPAKFSASSWRPCRNLKQFTAPRGAGAWNRWQKQRCGDSPQATRPNRSLKVLTPGHCYWQCLINFLLMRSLWWSDATNARLLTA